MTITYCDICGGMKFSFEKHKCPPLFYFKHEDWGDEWQEIKAFTFENAAELFAKKYNTEGDYCLMDDQTTNVVIFDGAEEKTFKVSAEQTIRYSAEEITG